MPRTVRPVLSSSLPGPPFVPWSTSLRLTFARPRRFLDQCSPSHRLDIRRCIDPATASPLPLCSDSRQAREPTERRGKEQLFASEASLERLWDGVVRIRGKKHVLREIHFHAMSFPNRDRRWYLDETVKDRGRGLRNTSCSPVGESLGAAWGNGAATLADLTRSGDHTQSDRGSEDLKVVIIDLVFQSLLPDLIEALKLVEIDGIAVRHNQTVENDGHPALLTEARRSNLLCFTENYCPLGNDDVLTIMRIQRV